MDVSECLDLRIGLPHWQTIRGVQGCNSIDYLVTSPDLSLVMFETCSSLVLKLSLKLSLNPNLNPKCILNCTPKAAEEVLMSSGGLQTGLGCLAWPER